MKKVIVTGVTGFIGMHLCETLLAKGVSVYGVGRNEAKLQQLSKNVLFHPIRLGFEDYYRLDKIIVEKDFDTFFHMAYLGVNGKEKNNYQIQITNTQVSCDVVKAAKNLECKRFLFSGSVDEYEAYFNPDDRFVLPSHSRIYGLTKFAAENIGKAMSLELGIEYVGVILSLTYGEGNKTNILPNAVIRKSQTNEPISLITGNNYFDMIYIEEAISGILAVAERGKNLESYFIGHEELRTFREIVEQMCSILNSNSELRFGDYKDPDYIMDFEMIHRDKLFVDTGYKCDFDFSKSLLRTKEWLLQQAKVL